MDIFYSIEIPAVVVIGIALGVATVMVILARMSSQIGKLSHPIAEDRLREAQREADEIVSQAQSEAREIIARAEAESQGVLEERQQESREIHEAYLQSLNELKDSLIAGLEDSAKGTREHSQEIMGQFSQYLETQSQGIQEEMHKVVGQLASASEGLEGESREAAKHIQERVERAGEEFEKALADVQAETRERIANHLKERFAEAEADIESYKKGRRELVDKHIEALVVDIVRITLHKELSKKGHGDLVRQALDEARRAGVV